MLCAYFKANSPNHSDLGVIGEMSAEFEYKSDAILVKGDYVRNEIKVNAPHDWLQPAQEPKV